MRCRRVAGVGVFVGGQRAVKGGVHRGRRGVTYVGCSVRKWRAVLGGPDCGCRGVAGVGVILVRWWRVWLELVDVAWKWSV